MDFLNQEFYNLIDGALVKAQKGGTMNIINPANNKAVAVVPKCTAEDVALAVAAAKRAKNSWKNTYVGDRAALLYKLGALVAAHAGELIPMETAQYGGPVSKTSNFDIPAAIGEFELMAGMGRSVTGTTITADPTARILTLREPYGVVGLITPWNFPLVTAVSKLAPALITGNTCVLKPPSCAPLTVLKLAEYAVEAGFPAGVINIVTGPGPEVGEAIVTHRDVNKISFTGDSRTGKRIMELASGQVKSVASELGGKNAMIVLDDAEIDAAVETAAYSAFFNSGQNCGSPSRFYVQEGIYDEFVGRFVRAAGKIVVGDPTDPKTMMGPLAYNACRDTAERYIASAKKAGGRLLLGGERPETPDMRDGAYVCPTIFQVYDNRQEMMQEEIFAPVVGVMKVKTADEAVDLANDCRYGLCASIWTRDYRKALKLIDRLEVGTAWINQHLKIVPETPWGGCKESGWTKENSMLVFEEYTFHKHVWLELSEQPHTFWETMLDLN
ncbi:betaine-aldehyde dehydrogenase [Sporobacter termitidis DSM 10068]|uniref:3-sulfolactaldehyde dehydrogenase n=1 Tax=Sporobacter termitidis DSM 10068 TaxID=1123282 RepID=A0A1M5Z1K1_9FIRM|nr:aldehyde dehydrogenase family protein [Sporobacter termitidis]SHI18137.1 betaine-aldehyde dehydrogenase [Sporobacter termitidis DSM 10068]